jgi:NADPH2 dehydrogenase
VSSEKLFSPLSFAGLRTRNRIVMPPMATAIEGPGGARSDDGIPSGSTLAYYRERSQNGVGMIIVEHTYVSKCGKAHKGQLGLHSDSAVESFDRLAAAIRAGGAVAAIQLNHAGSVANPEITGCDALGPSAIAHPRSTRKPVAMTIEDIERVQTAFALASARAKAAGFQAVEIHSAHGYLGTQFLSPLTNRRTDIYGGSLQNRARFILEIVARLKEEVGGEFPVFVRLGCNDGIEGGFSPKDASLVAKMLEESGADMIDVSGGFMGSRPANAGQGYFVTESAMIRKAVNIPVMVTGGITEPEFANKVLTDGHADLIGVGRALLRDPLWVTKAMEKTHST